MNKSTYYVIETAPNMYYRMAEHGKPHYATCIDDAMRFSEAWLAFKIKTNCEWVKGSLANTSRLPRIIKVTTETKTIKGRR